MAFTEIETAATQTLSRFDDWRAFQVADQRSFALAGDYRTEIKGAKERVSVLFDDDIKRAFRLHRSLTGKRNGFLERLDEIDRHYKQQRLGWQRAQEEKARAEQARIQAELDKRAEAERAARVAELERCAELAAERDDTEAFEALAARAESVAAAPAVSPVAICAPPVTPTAGISTVKTWKAEVTDILALARWALTTEEGHDARLGYVKLEARQTELNKYARLMQDKASLPGVRFFQDTDERVRTT